MVEQKVVPGKTKAVLRVRTGQTREYPNPFTGGTVVIEVFDHKDLKGPNQVAAAIKSRQDYEVEIAGSGKPKVPPLPINFGKAYSIAVACAVSSKLRSTSFVYAERPGNSGGVQFGNLCSTLVKVGQFSNPHNMKVIKVAGAGCARFWIEIELGKFLLPTINESLDILNPVIVHQAERVFGISFAQGCRWG
jgi:hypothetical protein